MRLYLEKCPSHPHAKIWKASLPGQWNFIPSVEGGSLNLPYLDIVGETNFKIGFGESSIDLYF